MELIFKVAAGVILAPIILFAGFWVFMLIVGGAAFTLEKIGKVEDATFHFERKWIQKIKRGFLYRILSSRIDARERFINAAMIHRKIAQ